MIIMPGYCVAGTVGTSTPFHRVKPLKYVIYKYAINFNFYPELDRFCFDLM